MAVEPKRGCGYRKAGGLYLVSGGLGEPCERLPVPLVPCPSCGHTVKQTRGFRWIAIDHVVAGAVACAFNPDHCPRCPICQPVLLERHADPKDRVGLVWAGEKFYPTPADWSREAATLGVSRRVNAIPKDLVLGKSWICVAHPKAITRTLPGAPKEEELLASDQVEHAPGIFHAFCPAAIELVVTPEMKKEAWVKEYVAKHGVRLVEVPADDPDHMPKPAKKSARAAATDAVAKRAARREKKAS